MPQRERPFSWAHVVALTVGLPSLGVGGGCGSVIATTGDAGAVDGGTPRDAGTACALPGGGTCAEGATCPSPDGCNTCTCTGGRLLACTERACAIDAGARDVGSPDVGVPDAAPCVPECAEPPPGCRYEGPTSCDPPSCGRLVCADAGSEIRCGAGGEGFFPSFDRSCRATTECVVAVHQTDCCGNSRATGINAAQREAFDAAEAICRPMYPGCGCAARPPVTDDGEVAGFSTAIPVECRAGVCTTFRRP